MTLLRPRTARAIATYPDAPVRYHRPFLRTVAGAFLVGESVLSILLTYFPEGKGDDLTGGDWSFQILFLVLLGGLYLYAASSLVVTRTHVVVRNPFRTAAIPLGQVEAAVSGSNLRIKTASRSFIAAGVEAANAQAFSDNFGTQGDLAKLINRVAAEVRARGVVDDTEPARYRFALPDPLFLAFAAIHVVGAVVLILNDGPLRLQQ
ncbi:MULTISPECIES: hypothetical protein [unclassified Kribbella]|uniref:hypothetical protein n=1 Tax=unclassified Kribbella TaxID=2644121 RepID=UPI0033DC3965